MAEKKLYSTGAMSKELGISAGVLKKAIAAAGVKPDEMKGKCAMYSAATMKKIKGQIKK